MPKQHHDKDGLTILQRKALAFLAQGMSTPAAAAKVGVDRTTVARWIRTDPAFQAKFNALHISTVEAARHQFNVSSERASERVVDMLDATKNAALTIQCPNCASSFEVEATLPDSKTRLKAAELILKAARVLKDVHEVQGEITHLSLEESIALAMYRAGHANRIPIPVWEKLQEKGMISQHAQQVPPTIEGEFHEIDQPAE